MTLSDHQIERFSRQIILPQIGGRGQERLLRASIALAGGCEVARTAALYLAGAGILEIALHGTDAARLRRELVELAPAVRVSIPGGALGSAAADVLVACDVTLAELDRAMALRRPLVAGGVAADGGWLVVANGPHVCASCAARRVALECGGLPPLWGGRGTGSDPTAPPTPKRQQAAALQSVSAGVIGSLTSLAVLKLVLGLASPPTPVWLHFDAVRSTLTEHPIEPAADCPACAAA